MIVLIGLILMCLPRPMVLVLRVGWSAMSELRAVNALLAPTPYTQLHPLAPIPVPTPRHFI